MDAVWHLIMAMGDRTDRIASALLEWTERNDASIEQLAVYLGCNAATLERLALLSMPKPGPDWDDDVEIIAISLRMRHAALRELLLSTLEPRAREFGA